MRCCRTNCSRTTRSASSARSTVSGRAMASELAFRDVSRSFGAVKALDGVTFSVAEGEIHALIGENGAGKSTLLKILAGIVQPERGQLFWRGEPLVCSSPRQALERGIGMVYQEMLAFPNLTVAGNIFAGREITKTGGRLDERAMHARTKALLDELHIPVSPDTPMEQLPAALSQLVQVARALAFDCKVLVLDEPTTSLTDVEVDHLFREVRALKARGMTVLFVSHRIPEVFRLCDRITVMRDGKYAGTFDRETTTPDTVVRAMVGRTPPPRLTPAGSAHVQAPVRLEVRGLGKRGRFSDVSLAVRKGEVVALFGLVGSGRSDVLEAIFGTRPADTGTVEVDGAAVRLNSARAAAQAGLSLVPEDRQRQGLCFALSQRDNIAIPRAEKIGAARVNRLEETSVCDAQRQGLNIKTPSLDSTPDTLSGGNQQKVVAAKWLATSPKVLLLDEPTKGVDVGAKFEIHGIIRREVDAGMACLMVSSDLPEVLALADRILVMREGRLQGELAGATATDDAVMRLATHEATA
ncbi:MAG: sugar ABC transporter ATP-binding protein [Acidobacteria bacterium]|nr:MAG: sugar ABC transporter ATP-binding protein [Acidobacteriota bacterium]